MPDAITLLQRLTLATLLLCGSTAAQADCKPAHTFDTLEKGVLKVATYVFPPYAIPGPDGQVGGVEGDILKSFATAECLTVRATTVDTAAVVQSVITRRADVGIGDWYRTAERAKVLGLSAPTFLDVMGIISKDNLSRIDQLEGKRVGTVQGYLWVADLKKVLGDNLVLYPNPVAMAQDLASGRLDVATDSFAVAKTAQQKGAYPGASINVAVGDPRVKASQQPGQAAILFAKQNEALGQALSAHIQHMHEDGSLRQIVARYGLEEKITDVGAPRLIE
ncbi:transporter substrate-binding domain-containing protein [Pseudomonas oryzihabitans]|uniref:substrate-binding periplasmic protein n=1 Tax=Pseudomonas oryzihabitans TaxID=47885 RepID=UPI002895F0D5|nr:transporter substrate-binding domain-containing protein [Pseudomonas oryzihabitans]MDT3718165.1 transporter substrate-binding domain-containing protein [Pseudomonas oryzihabitans]